jgi:hypothetical protein
MARITVEGAETFGAALRSQLEEALRATYDDEVGGQVYARVDRPIGSSNDEIEVDAALIPGRRSGEARLEVMRLFHAHGLNVWSIVGPQIQWKDAPRPSRPEEWYHAVRTCVGEGVSVVLITTNSGKTWRVSEADRMNSDSRGLLPSAPEDIAPIVTACLKEAALPVDE